MRPSLVSPIETSQNLLACSGTLPVSGSSCGLNLTQDCSRSVYLESGGRRKTVRPSSLKTPSMVTVPLPCEISALWSKWIYGPWYLAGELVDSRNGSIGGV